jgi:hypothetical protein
MQFALFDAALGGARIGSTFENTVITVNSGIFTAQLGFGALVFSGADRFLEIRVRRNSNESHTALTPRQRITSAPHCHSLFECNNGDQFNMAWRNYRQQCWRIVNNLNNMSIAYL